MAYTKDQSRDEFRRWSRNYDESILQRLLFVPSHNCILEQIGDSPMFRLLDIGCGTGVFLLRVHETYPSAEVWGLDYCRDMIEQGRNRFGTDIAQIRWLQGDSEKLPFPTGSFDVVTCANSFHHYPNQAGAVSEMHRLLRPGGRLMILDGYRDRLWGRFIYDFCVGTVEGEVHHASARRFRDMFAHAGFSEIWQQVKLGLAPFLLTVGSAGGAVEEPAIPQEVAAGQAAA